jgi:hypothetical protein|tara:strand:- start:1479 stop:1697 length:219 start_codon:yes stop_codon:yes gene_type:complete
MIALMQMTNPMWEWLLAPLFLMGIGMGVGWLARGLADKPMEPRGLLARKPGFRQASSVRLLPGVYDWEKETD